MGKKKSLISQKSSAFWMMVFTVSLILSIMIAVIMLVYYAKDENLPADIDIVVTNRVGNEKLLDEQLKFIDKYMPWRRNIIVLSSVTVTDGPAGNAVKRVWYHEVDLAGAADYEAEEKKFLDAVREAYIVTPTGLEALADHFMYLGSSTFPTSLIQKTYLFHGEHPRIFNVFRNSAEQAMLGAYYQYTIPGGVIPKDIMEIPAITVEDVLFNLITQDRMVLRNDINLDVLLRPEAKWDDNRDEQFASIATIKPFFTTFHYLEDDDMLAEVLTWAEGWKL